MKMKFCRPLLLAALVLLASVAECFAVTPAIDASGAAKTLFNSASSGSINVSTTSTNDLILLFVTGTRRSTPSAAISSVAGGGLTWAKRTNQQTTWTTDCFAGNTCFGDVEIWWACSSSALSSSSMTVTMDRSTDEVTLIAFGVTGICPTATPFDTNGGLPVTAANTTGSNANIQLSASTTQTSDLIFIVVGSGNFVLATGDQSCSGWQQYTETDSTGPSDYSVMQVTAKAFTSAQSGLTVRTFGTSCGTPETTHPWTAIADAVANASTSPAGGSLMLMGVGQ